MKIGDLVRVKEEMWGAGYHQEFLGASWLVTNIVTRLEPGEGDMEIDPLVECISQSGHHVFPQEDMEVIHESR